jgi:hypothetical protein
MAYCRRSTSCRCDPLPAHRTTGSVDVPSRLTQYTPHRFFSSLFSKLCCREPLEKLVELKNEECYEKELSDAALAAASGATPAQDQGEKKLTQLDELQLSQMIGMFKAALIAFV